MVLDLDKQTSSGNIIDENETYVNPIISFCITRNKTVLSTITFQVLCRFICPSLMVEKRMDCPRRRILL